MPAAANKVSLTDKFLKALKPAPAGKRVTYWDVEPGLAVQVGARGKPSFFAVRRLPGATQPTWRKLGEYPTVGLAEARKRAREALKLIAKGQDPKVIAETERREEAGAAAIRSGPSRKTSSPV